MSVLSEKHPRHNEFLQWHYERMSIYHGAPVVAELIKKACDWITKDIRLVVKAKLETDDGS